MLIVSLRELFWYLLDFLLSNTAHLTFLVIFNEFYLIFISWVNCKAVIHRLAFVLNFLPVLDIERATLDALLS